MPYDEPTLFGPGIVDDPRVALDFIANILQSSTDYSIVAGDLDGKILLWNEGAHRNYGYAPGEVIGKMNLSQLHLPRDAESGLPGRIMAEVLHRGKFEGTLSRRRKSGEHFTARVVITPRRSSDGEAAGFLLISKDISDEIRANALLKQSEANLRAVVDHTIDGLITIDERGNIENFNPACERIFGYEAGEVLGQNIKILMPEPFYSGHDGYLARYAETGEASIIGTAGREVSGLRKDGSIFPMDLSVSAFRLNDGRRFSGIIRDITARKAAERLLRESEQRLNFALETTGIGAWELNLADNTAKRTAGHDLIFGYRHMLPSWTFELFMDHIVPEDRAFVEREFQQAVENKSEWDFECRIHRADGEERWIQAKGRHHFDLDSETPKMSGIVQDITENKLAQENIRRANETREQIFGAVSEGIIIVDAATGTFSQVNEPGAAMYGYQREEMIGRDIAFISSNEPPYTQEDATARIDRAAATGETQIFDWRAKKKDGRLFWANVSLRFATIAGRSVVLSIVRDVTEQRATEDQLRQSQKMEAIGSLTGGMAHDFNNILSVIIGSLDMLLAARPDDSEVRELSTDALDAAVRGADLTRRMLAFARRNPLQPQCVQLNNLIAEITKLLSRVLGADIEIVTRLADDAWPVTADPVQLDAALTNLATNARDAMANGGKITIATRNCILDAEYAALNMGVVPGEYTAIEFTDTGAGMSPAVAARIFEPFYSTKERDKGTGLGLSMVFGFVKQSGGHINVYSEVGVGSTFRLYFPRNLESTDAGNARSERIEALPKGVGETVLTVEDNTALRRIVVRQLNELGYQVLQANDAVEALRLLESGGVDLLLTDIVMPGKMDGYELAIAALAQCPTLKIVLTSGFPEARQREGLVPLDLPFLPKPFRKDELASLLRDVLAA